MVKTSFCCHDDEDSGVSPASSSAVTGLMLPSDGSASDASTTISVTVATSVEHVVLSTTVSSTGLVSVIAVSMATVAGAMLARVSVADTTVVAMTGAATGVVVSIATVAGAAVAVTIVSRATAAGPTVGGIAVSGATVAEATVAEATVAEATVAEATVAEATVAGAVITGATVAGAAVTVATISLAVVTTGASADCGGSMRRLSLPYSELMKENPLNSSWLMALMMVGSMGVRIGSSDVKSLSKLFASVRDFCWKKVCQPIRHP